LAPLVFNPETDLIFDYGPALAGHANGMVLMALDAQVGRLQARRGAFEKDVSKLPDTQQTALRLKRDVEVSTTLYTNLLNTAQQLRVSKAGTVGDVRIIDDAAAARLPVEPKAKVILVLAAVLGLFLALSAVWLRCTLRMLVEDPEKIESQLGLPVYATVPHSKAELEIARAIKSGKGVTEQLAITKPEDDAVESLRSLRTTLHFALLDADKGSILITGPSPGVGKSFISRNLGVVLAQAGKNVVVIDADLRRGHIHRDFGFPRENGVSDYVGGEQTLSNIVRPTSIPGLSVVTTGQIPPNPSEVLMHPRFEDLLQRLGEIFDILIIDAPPMLAVSDAAIIGRHTGATLLVARAGMHPMRELEQSVKRLAQAGVQAKGFVFNDYDLNRQRYRYGYKGYVYRYSYK
jgi:tyrosine-protein kinase Etk/Wzc